MKKTMLPMFLAITILLTGCAGVSETNYREEAVKQANEQSDTAKYMYDANATKNEAKGKSAEIHAASRADSKLIYNADLSMEVDDFKNAQKQVEAQVTAVKGYVLSFSDRLDSDIVGGFFEVKVPANKLQTFIAGLEALAPLSFSRDIRAEDVGEEYVDLQARLKVKQSIEARMMQLMEKATSSQDLMSFAVKVGEIQEEIESLKGRIQYIDRNVAFSTVNISLSERLYGQSDSGASYGLKLWVELKAGLYGIIEFFAGSLLFLMGALPTLILLAIVIAVIWWVWRRTRKKADAPDENRVNEQ
jgi:hypothetical protein